MAWQTPAKTQTFVFLLLENFTLSSLAGGLEPLRLANRASGQTLYEVRVVSETGAPVLSSSGVAISCNGALEDLSKDSTIIVVSGINVHKAMTRGILTWLLRQSRKGLAIGGFCTATHVLAEAGLLDNRQATIHWENRDSFEEQYPDVLLTEKIFVIDANRFTASGGTASIDLMLTLIARSHGSDLANRVADQLIHTSLRSGKEEQRLSIPTRIGVRHPKLAAIIQRMEENIEEPISPTVLAQEAGLSTRQLERLFRRYLNRSPKRYYMELRLQKARNLLLQTDMSVINVALACGFTSPSHFSKCYRGLYETTPYRERGTRSEPA
ncbi:MAG: GlxA family transcriptional regulator [Pseudomonadota bacterium]